MSLIAWEKNGWLVAHKASPQEIQDLLGVAERDLQDCATKGLSDDWRLAIAYNAAPHCYARRPHWPPVAIGRRVRPITFGSFKA